MLKVKYFTFNPFAENTYLVFDEATRETAIIDPGCFTDAEQAELEQYIEEHELVPTLLLNTHCHIDHVLGNAYVKRKWDIPFRIHELDRPTLEAIPAYAPVYGFTNYEAATPDEYLTEGESIRIGSFHLKVIFTPGHAPGHVVFYAEDEKFCINGDCLFAGSIGRTDLPGGDFDTLIRSIKTKLFRLPDETVVYCGHGPSTTIKQERQHNPFLQ